jgi:acetyl esterase/lipase
MLNDERGSLRSRGAAAVSSLTLRQIAAVIPAEQAWGVWLSRRIIAGVMDTCGPSLAGTHVVPVDARTSDGRRVKGEWVYGAGVRPQTPDSAIYFVHGSGYVLCSPRTHRRLVSWLSRLTGLPVFSIDYRLAPKYRFPTAADDVRSGWDWLTGALGLAPENVVMAGDSAGGHLIVDLLLHSDVSHPAAAVLLSPVLDLTFTLARTRERLRRDPAIRSGDAIRLLKLYCADIDSSHPRLELDVATGRTLPPTLIQAGGAEMLAADAIALADRIREAGGQCELQIWPDQVHVFQALPRISPEAGAAMRHITGFIAHALRNSRIGKTAG